MGHDRSRGATLLMVIAMAAGLLAGPSAGAVAQSAGTPMDITVADAPLESALPVAWQGASPEGSGNDCTAQPTIAPDGRLWVAACKISQFWVYNPDGTFSEAWGTPGADDGQLDMTYNGGDDYIGGVAFAPDGSMWTYDAGNERLQHFGADGSLLGAYGGFGAGDGQFAKPAAIGVDSQGMVYVADGNRHDIQVFSPDGSFVRAIAQGCCQGFAYMTVAPDGTVYVAAATNTLEAYAGDGTHLATYHLPGDPAGSSLAPDGSLYIVLTQSDEPESLVQLDPADGAVLHRWPASFEAVAVAPDGELAVASGWGMSQPISYTLP